MSVAAKRVAVAEPTPDANESTLIHGPYWPSEVRRGEGISAQVRNLTQGEVESRDLQVWRLSPLGAELLQPMGGAPVRRGDRVDAALRLGSQLCRFSGLVVSSVAEEGGRSLIGLRWCQDDGGEPAMRVQRRTVRRWLCSEAFLPTGVSANPVKFNDFIHYRIVDLSRDGMKIMTSLRNKLLVPQMRLEAILSFPMIGEVRATFQIAWTRIVSDAGKDVLALGVSFVKPSRELLEAVGQYLLQFGAQASVTELRRDGMHVKAASQAMEFSYVKTEEEYHAVLKLRKMAYAGVGKVPEELDWRDMGDVYDTRARILIAKHHGEIVASLRLIFHGPDDQMEHEQFLTFPDDFPRKDEIVELTRVCTHPDYRTSDLLLALIQQQAIAIVQSGRRWMVGSATDKLLPFYLKVGCKATPLKYRHKDLGDEEHTIIISDIPRAAAGIGINALVWGQIYADMVGYLTERNMLEFDMSMNLRMAYCRALRPLGSLLYRRQIRRKGERKGQEKKKD
jgi:predicted GNAT family N-acyltransferase